MDGVTKNNVRPFSCCIHNGMTPYPTSLFGKSVLFFVCQNPRTLGGSDTCIVPSMYDLRTTRTSTSAICFPTKQTTRGWKCATLLRSSGIPASSSNLLSCSLRAVVRCARLVKPSRNGLSAGNVQSSVGDNFFAVIPAMCTHL